MTDQLSLFTAAHSCLKQEDISLKCSLTNQYKLLWDRNKLSLHGSNSIEKITIPGRPIKPELVLPRELPKRKLGNTEGRAALLHAIAHIEFNAINLAWDAVYRFQNMPVEYYSDWVNIAVEEAKHFKLVNDYLHELGYAYGDFVAHNGLWELAVDTDYDILARMALVPRIMEARGLDVTPGIIDKFTKINDDRAVEILNVILTEEKGHVAVGNRWFNYICKQREVEPLTTFKNLILKHVKGQIKPPFAREHRLSAGFSVEELDLLENI